MPYDVFISYSSANSAEAQAICVALEAAGLTCWIAPRNIVSGEDWATSIINGINSCRIMLVIFSEHSNTSLQVGNEVERAIHKRLPVITVRLQDLALTPHLEYFLSSRHWFEAHVPPFEQHLSRLVPTVQQALTTNSEGSGSPAPRQEQTGPYAPTDAPPPLHEVIQPQPPSDLSPIESLESIPNNLPIQLTSFVGREREMQEVKSLLASHPLVTLLGPGGTGKTRISLQIGADLLKQYSDGVWLVELAPVADPALVARTIASAIGAKEEGGNSLTQTLVETLKTRRLLLIVDNCEHVIAVCARLVQTLLQSCPHLHILASSREGLNIPGETLYHVPSLQLPDPKIKHTVETLTQYEAVRLFVDRAISIQSAFAVTNQNAPALAQLCTHLDGIPLAIELAAARIRSLSVEEINAKLDNCFRLLTGGSRTALPRQQTLRALIDWSHDLLAAPEKTLLRRLSVFAGGWTLEAAEAVCTGEEVEDWEVLDLLTSLGDKSLVVADQEGERTRYRLLETIRQYARDRLLESGEAEGAHQRHHAWFAQLVEATSTRLSGPEQQAALETLEKEHDNLRAALEWAIANQSPAALPMAAAMGYFWYLGGYLREGREQLEQALTIRPAEQEPETLVDAYFQMGCLAVEQQDFEPARSHLERCVTLARQIGNKRRAASALNSLGVISVQQSNYAAARSFFEQSLALQRELKNQIGIASTLSNLGNLVQDQGDYAAASTLYEESLILCQEIGNKRNIATNLLNLGNTLCLQGDLDRARNHLEQSLAIGQELNDDWYQAYSLCSLARILTHRGEYAQARALAEEGLSTVRKVGDVGETANALATLGEIACLEGDYTLARSLLTESLTLNQKLGQRSACANLLEDFAGLALALAEEGSDQEMMTPQVMRALRLFGAAEAHRALLGTPLPPVSRSRYDGQVRTLLSAVGKEMFAAVWAEGQTMSLEEAIAYVLSDANGEA
jgi:non-specific serine/threonine protein kinase